MGIFTPLLSEDTFIGLLDTPTTYSGGHHKYTKVKDDFSGLEFAYALAGVTSSGTTPPDHNETHLWYNSHPDWNMFFIWDVGRQKWLSMAKQNYLFAYGGSVDGAYVSIGNVTDSSAYYYIPRTATITAIMASEATSGGSEPTKEFELQNAGVAIAGGYFKMSNYEYFDLSTDIDLDDGTQLQLYAYKEGAGSKNPIIMLELSWRYPTP